MDSFRLIELTFGTITSAGVLYALLSPLFKTHSRKTKIKQIIKQELDENREAISGWLFMNDPENEDEDNITVGSLYLCCAVLRNTCWRMLRKEASELFNPQVFITIDAYYYEVEVLREIASRLKAIGVVDDEMKIKLKECIPFLDFNYALGPAIEVIYGCTERYLKMLKKDKEEVDR